MYEVIDWCFTIGFSVEIGLKLFAYWDYFWIDNWNIYGEFLVSLVGVPHHNHTGPRFLCCRPLPAGQNHYALADELDGESNGQVPCYTADTHTIHLPNHE
jgi:hypothetical protein